MTKILILGAGFFQLGLIQKAKDLGNIVITLSNDDNDIGHKYSDKSYSISTTEREKILEISKKEEIDAIVTAGSDIALSSVTYVAENMGLSSVPHNAAEIVTYKNRFRKHQQLIGDNHPKFLEKNINFKNCYEFSNLVGCPFVLKPIHSSGSKNIRLIRSTDDLFSYFYENGGLNIEINNFIAEEYIPGKEYGCEAFLENFKMISLMLTEKKCNLYHVPIFHNAHPNLSNETVDIIKTKLIKIARSLGVKTSPMNADIIIKGDQPIIIEMSFRLGGNWLPELTQESASFDSYLSLIQFSLGKEIPSLSQSCKSKKAVAIIGSDSNGTIEGFVDIRDIMKKNPEIIRGSYQKKIGEEVSIFCEGKNFVGIFLINSGMIHQGDEYIETLKKEISLFVR